MPRSIIFWPVLTRPGLTPTTTKLRNIIRAFPIVFTTLAISACAFAVGASNGAKYIGEPPSTLVAKAGMPSRQMTSPAGNTVYVYEAHDYMSGQAGGCEGDFFIRDDRIVGYSAHGVAHGCDYNVGDTR